MITSAVPHPQHDDSGLVEQVDNPVPAHNAVPLRTHGPQVIGDRI